MKHTMKKNGWVFAVILFISLNIAAISHAAVVTATLDWNSLSISLYEIPLNGNTLSTPDLSNEYRYVGVGNYDDDDADWSDTGSDINAELQGTKASFEASTLSLEISSDESVFAYGFGGVSLTTQSAGLLAISVDYNWSVDTPSLSENDDLYLDFQLYADNIDNSQSYRTEAYMWSGDIHDSSSSDTLYLYIFLDEASELWIHAETYASLSIAPIPVPGSFLLLFCGLSVIVAATRRNNGKQKTAASYVKVVDVLKKDNL